MEIIEPTDELSLEQALSLALLKNPSLVAQSWEVRAAEARVLQARLFPNPELELEVDEYNRGGNGFATAETAVALGQLIELGGKRQWRMRVAKSEGELAGWDYESKRLDLLSETVKQFIAVLTAQRRLDLADSMVDLAEKTSRTVNERVEAGKEPPHQTTKVNAEMEITRIEQFEAQIGLDTARKRLGALWGNENPTFHMVKGNLDTVPDSVPAIDVLWSCLSKNPDLARWDAELRQRRATLSSAKAERIPDIKATIGFKNFEEDATNAMVFGVGVLLPLFDRNQGNIASANYELSKAEIEYKAAKTAAAIALEVAYAEFITAHRRVLTLRTKVVPAMESAFLSAQKGYEQGKFGFLDILDAQRRFFESKSALVTSLFAYHTAVAEIERVTGTSINDVTMLNKEEQK
ncbi:MAG: TolC family protein [Chlamydiota bacterium]|nr:TolC family protein [Chlamydiota bacterium]